MKGAKSKPRLLISAFCLVFVCACSSAAADPYDGSLDRSLPRGSDIKTFKVPGRPDEICVIPNHLSLGTYSTDDTDAEARLAGYDFYKAGNTPDDNAVALCPKDKSTSAAVELYEIPSGTTKAAVDSPTECLKRTHLGKCLAKFKQTDNEFTTTSTAADLAYYHISRILGGICEIKPVVLRTMDIEQHKKVVAMVKAMGVTGRVRKSWDLFDKYYADPQHSEVKQTLFTSDFKQIYGALIENTSGEENYAEWLKPGDNLPQVRAFADMANPKPVREIIGSTQFNSANVQRLVAMKDMGEMILIDYILSQSDRLTGGNISDYNVVFYLDGGQVKSVRAKKASKIPSGDPQAPAKLLVIKDTDAGLINGNVFAQRGYLSQISHMNPDTYSRFMTFAHAWQADQSVQQFFHRDCTLTTRQLAEVGGFLQKAAATLQARKDSGKLLLDLDLNQYFSSTK